MYTPMNESFTIVSIDRETEVKLVEKTSSYLIAVETAEENRLVFPYVVVFSDIEDSYVLKFVNGRQVI